MRNIDEAFIQNIMRTIVEHFQPRRIVLFGSHARGEAGPDSDLDLMVEMESDQNFIERTTEVYRQFGLRDWAMDLLVLTPEEVSSKKDVLGTVVYTIEREGRTLYEKQA